MQKIKELLAKYELKPLRYDKMGKVTIVGTRDGNYVLKKHQKNNIYDYLNSRNFNYYPKILGIENDYEISEYISEINMPSEQKITDMIDLVALLHNKTTFFKEVDEEVYKKIYEDINNNIDYLNNYYEDTISIIETRVYMSPSEYLLARNISKILSSLNFCKHEIDNWYNLVKNKRKQT